MNANLRVATAADASVIAVVGTNVWIDTYAGNGLTPESNDNLTLAGSRSDETLERWGYSQSTARRCCQRSHG